MRMLPAILLVLLLLVLVSHRSYAAQPITSSGGLSVVYPQAEFYPQNMASSLRFSVFNVSNAPAVGASCYITIYNHTGQQLVNNAAMPLVSGSEYGYDLPYALYTLPGTYQYAATCNSSSAWGYVSYEFQVKQGSASQTDFPVSAALVLLGVFFFSLFFASYFAVQKHPLVYLFTMLAFFIADVLIWLNWRILSFNNSPLVGVFLGLFIGFLSITFVMAIVTMLDLTRMVIQSVKKKEAAANIARFGYA